jgi:hypothetical protein
LRPQVDAGTLSGQRMSDPLSFQATATWREYVLGLYLEEKPRRAFAVLGLLFIGIAAALIAALVFLAVTGRRPSIAAGALLIVWPFIVGLAPLRRMYRASMITGATSTVDVDGAGVRVSRPPLDVQLLWSDLRGWRESPTLIVILGAQRHAPVVIPKRALSSPEQIGHLRALISAHVGGAA